MFTGGPFPFDLTFSHWLQSWQAEAVTSVMKIFSLIGEPILFVSLFLLLAAMWFGRSKQSLAVLIIIILAGNALTLGLKSFFDRPRPTADAVVVMVQESGHSFPSGHAMAAILVAGLIIYLTYVGNGSTGFVSFLSFIFVVGVGISRIYLGVHWLSDVLGGYAVGLLWLLVVFWLIWPRVRLRMVHAEQASIEVIGSS